MGKKSNNISLHLNNTKTWISSWFLNTKEYFKTIQNDTLLYLFFRSFFIDKKKKNFDLLQMRLYRMNNSIIIDLTVITLRFFKEKKMKRVLSYLNSSIFEKKHFFIALKKITYSKAFSYASYVAIKLAKFIEKRVRFRSKIVKLFLKRVLKDCNGVYALCTGRINNVDMARTDRLFLGSIPLQTIRIPLDYSLVIANTRKGLQSIKVWINK